MDDKFLKFKVSEQAKFVIEQIARATNRPLQQVIIQALGFYAWGLHEVSKGAQIGSVTKTEEDEDAVEFINLGKVDKEEINKIFIKEKKDLN